MALKKNGTHMRFLLEHTGLGGNCAATEFRTPTVRSRLVACAVIAYMTLLFLMDPTDGRDGSYFRGDPYRVRSLYNRKLLAQRIIGRGPDRWRHQEQRLHVIR